MLLNSMYLANTIIQPSSVFNAIVHIIKYLPGILGITKILYTQLWQALETLEILD